jgi:hypothetical protein
LPSRRLIGNQFGFRPKYPTKAGRISITNSMSPFKRLTFTVEIHPYRSSAAEKVRIAQNVTEKFTSEDLRNSFGSQGPSES